MIDTSVESIRILMLHTLDKARGEDGRIRCLRDGVRVVDWVWIGYRAFPPLKFAMSLGHARHLIQALASCCCSGGAYGWLTIWDSGDLHVE